MMRLVFGGALLFALMGCQETNNPRQAVRQLPENSIPDLGSEKNNEMAPAADQFMGNLAELCGKSYEGKVISDDPVDADWAKEVLTIHVADCRRTQISIPLHVGTNRSRTWVFTQLPDALRLKHDHRHKDGTSDAVTMYGGDTADPGTAQKQSFPVDAESIALFEKEDLSASVTNVWSVTVIPGQSLTYELKRPSRLFQTQFDLTKAVPNPPPAWGHE